ncbi:MAG: tetratricopeptide repeat-containing sensor histidine kinase [Cyclobacteriaceae bacterium]
MSRYIFIFFIFLALIGRGQSKEGLMEALGRADSSSLDSISYELFKYYMSVDINEAKKFGRISYRYSTLNKNFRGIAKASRALAYVYNRIERFDSAVYFFSNGIEAAKKGNVDDVLVSLYVDFGIFHETRDTYDSALKYYNRSLDISTKIADHEGMAAAYNNIGLIYYYLNNHEEALSHYEKAIEIKKRNGREAEIPVNLMNMALIYNDQGKFELAILTLSEVEKICNGECSDKIVTDLNYDLGYAYFEKNELDKALKYLTTAYELAKSTNNKKILAQTLHRFAKLRLIKQDYNGAIEYLKESEVLSREINLRRLLRDIYDTYRLVYQAQGDLTKVVEFQNKYMLLKDSIFNEKLASNLKDIQLDAQRKQSEVIIQQKDSEIERVRLITTLVGVISILLVAVSVLIYRNYRASHRMKKILEKEIEKRTGELVKSNSELTKMTQEYDQLVYRASHDIRGPLATLMGLTNIAKQDYDEPLRVKDYLGKIESTASGLNQTLSQLMETNRIRNLPICVEEINISEVLDEVYSSFKSLNHFPLIQLRIEKGDWSTPLLSDRHLISFVLSKLLDNAFKYFSSYQQEKYIKVSWSQSEGKTVIAVEDNGQGISSNAKEKIFQLFYVASDVHGSGLGLFLAQMAANRLGGRVILARSSSPTVFKLIISTNLATAQVEDKPVMTVAS